MSKILTQKEAIQKLKQSGNGFYYVQNPDFIYPAFELYPVPPKSHYPLPTLHGIVMDMDGTTTSTEVLCIHALEYMVRLITGNEKNASWQGLNPITDYPHIIGNSTTRHVEYLIKSYMKDISSVKLYEHFLDASVWNAIYGKDEARKNEVLTNLRQIGGNALYQELQSVKKQKKISASEISTLKQLFPITDTIQMPDFNTVVRLAIDIYYQRYHYILQQIDNGKGASLTHLLPPELHKRFIEPMEGIGEFLALAKGLLKNEAGNLTNGLIQKMQKKSEGKCSVPDKRKSAALLNRLSKRFSLQPVKVAVVTSSIRYEAEIVLKEVFNNLREDVKLWQVSDNIISDTLQAFSSPEHYYDALITASDSHEIRLKPHRDLYSIALHKMGIPKEQFQGVIGFEDSESGNIAIKAAGIGTAVAVPFAQTANHNLEAADFIALGGIPEVILNHKLFLE
ncbi:MAG: HAD family phosphatase [Ignavibacteriales bacterium]|nr:HAD family phosphatase [Ignavibacteriales bacterium]